jgi:NADPH2:quinone reductase
MKAVVFDRFGPAEVLHTTDVATPAAKAGEVLIKISHTSVNPVDYKIRLGYLEKALPHRFPIIPGWDAAGEIAAVGPDVRGFSVGERVYAYTRLPEVHAGTYAEYIALPAGAVAKAPAKLSDAEAAAIPLVALTAYQALHEVVRVKAGDQVLVTGGAGGVGSFAVQLAKLAGAIVTTTAGTANQAYVKELGATNAIDYTKSDVTQAARQIAPAGFDIVLDAVGGRSLQEASGLLKDGGRLVSIVDAPARGSYHFVYPNGEQLGEIARLFDDGKLAAPAIKIGSVKDAAAAQQESEQRHIRGKLVLKIDFQ